MAKVQLKQNLIFGGAFHRLDTILEEDEIPPNLRGPEYIKPPGPPPEPDWEEFPLEDEGIEESLEPPPPPPKKR